MKDLLREAKKAARKGDFSRAGDLCDMAGHPLDAIAYYVQGRHHLLAGQLAARIGEHAQAAGYFSRAGDTAQAAEMYIKSGQKKKASMMYEQAGQFLKAAELEEAMTNFPAAAALYEMGGRTERAAYLFAKAGDNGRAANLYEDLLRKGSRDTSIDSGSFDFADTGRRNAKYTRFAGILYLKAAQFSKAGPFLEQAGLFNEAVEAYRKSGKTDRATALLIRLENYSEALKLVEDEPNTEIEPNLLGELYLRSGRYERAAEVFLAEGLRFKAAECFESGGECAKAAELFAAEGELRRAGDLYSGMGMHEEAARSYEKAGESTNAARAYEKANKHKDAARVYESTGRMIDAARLHLDQGNESQAIRLLQQAQAKDPDFGQAAYMLGVIFFNQQLYTPAVTKLETAMRHLKADSRMECIYRLALTYEQMGRVQEACKLYEKILTIDYHHADVADRLKVLARRVSQQPNTSQQVAIAPDGSPSRPTQAPGITGRLEFTQHLGKGRYATVVEAYDRVLQKKVAAKQYPPSAGGEPDMVGRFMREAQKLSDLNHPNLVNVYGTGEDHEGRYIIEELVEGRTLRDMLDEKIRIEPARVIEYATQICDLLIHAHRKGIIHRDLRPENIFILSNDQVKVSDFGLKARLTDEVAVEGQSHCYLSPEAIRSERVDGRSDIYSLGIVLYEMLLGEPPFPADTASFDHLNVVPQFPKKVDRMVPGFMRKIIEKCLEKDRTRRYRSAEQVFDELKASAIVPGVVIAERYEIVSELGIGGMGRIYQAIDRDLDEPVALKMLRSGNSDERHVERFLREIKMTRRITHPNVVKVFDLGNWREHKYITMEYIEGLNLEQYVRLRDELDIPKSVRLIIDIGKGLAAAHALGIIHRDVKPQNILLQDGKIPKILDFGIARGTEGSDMTTEGYVMGSPKYMSPEQVQASTLDLRTDIYSLGVVAYFVFTGREPFVGDTPSVIAYKHVGEAPRPPRHLNGSLPVWLNDLILKALAKRPQDRFQSMEEMVESLDFGLNGASQRARSSS